MTVYRRSALAGIGHEAVRNRMSGQAIASWRAARVPAASSRVHLSEWRRRQRALATELAYSGDGNE